MISALNEHLEQGWLQLYCVDSIDGESWYNKSIGGAGRARREGQYNYSLIDEVLPFINQHNANPFLIRTGTGLITR